MTRRDRRAALRALRSATGCDASCWEPTRCEHGREMTPIGRSVPLHMPVFCECYTTSQNRRHLWHEHDSTRHYTDPEGWAAHEATCDQCRGDDE